MASSSTPVRLYVFGVALAAGLVSFFLLRNLALPTTFLLSWLILAGLDFLCELYEIQLFPHHMVSAGIAVGAAGVLIGGPELGILTVLGGTFLSEVYLRRSLVAEPGRFATVVGFNVSQLVLAVAGAGLLYRALGGGLPPFTALDFARAGAVFLSYSILNVSLVTTVVYLETGLRWWPHFRGIFRTQVVQLITLGVLAVLLALLHSLAPWYVILGVLPLFVVQVSLREQVRLREQTREAFEKLSRAINARDPYTGEHSDEVTNYAVKLARALRLPEEQVERIEAAARIHDLGKVAVPDAILLKPGPFTPEEWEVMKRHPVVAADLISGLVIYKNAVEIIRHEHEHWDGSGYPDGLKKEAIPIGSRIIAVADVWHALISDRPYRKAYSVAEAKEILRSMAGKVLDPRLVEIFLGLIE